MNGQNDHDLLIKVATILEVVQVDIKEIKESFKVSHTECDKRVDECEKRFVARKEMEAAKTTAGWLGAGAAAVVSALVWVGKAMFGIGG